MVWFYCFNAPGSTRNNRVEIRASGFATKWDAVDPEAVRRIDEEQKYETARTDAVVVGEVPRLWLACSTSFSFSTPTKN
jgi:hypothetical protein